MTGWRDNAHAFDTGTLANIMTLDISYVTAYLTGQNIDVFGKDVLLLPYEKDRHYSVFAIRLGDHPCILHFDPLGLRSTHDTRYISHKIRRWLNSMWRHKVDRTGCTYENPYNKRSMPDHLPEGRSCQHPGPKRPCPSPLNALSCATRSAMPQRHRTVRNVRPEVCT